jgi:hypothetical protein
MWFYQRSFININTLLGAASCCVVVKEEGERRRRRRRRKWRAEWRSRCYETDIVNAIVFFPPLVLSTTTKYIHTTRTQARLFLIDKNDLSTRQLTRTNYQRGHVLYAMSKRDGLFSFYLSLFLHPSSFKYFFSFLFFLSVLFLDFDKTTHQYEYQEWRILTRNSRPGI